MGDINRIMERFGLDETTARRVYLMYGKDTETILEKRRPAITARQQQESEAWAAANRVADMGTSSNESDERKE